MMNLYLSKLSGISLCIALALTLFGCATNNGALLTAIESNNVNQIDSLLASGADINVKNEIGSTPLHASAERGYKDVAAQLIEKGADVNTRSQSGSTPLHVAAGRGHKDTAALLIAKGADVNAKDKYGATPLYAAADNPLHIAAEHKDVAALLIANGADVNARNQNGATPLHAAAKQGYMDVTELLIANGADINAKDKYGATSHYAAAERGHKDVAALLIANGANVKAKIDDATLHATDVEADQGFYVAADLVRANYSNFPVSGLLNISIGVGYNFNPYVGVEAGYSPNIGSSSSDTCPSIVVTCPQETLKASTSQAAVVGTIPLNDRNDVFVKLGWANTSLDYSYSYTPCFIVLGICSPTISGSGSATKTNPMFGIGWQTPSKLNQHFKWRVQYENFGNIKMTTTFNNQPSKTYGIKISVISVGIAYNF